MQGRTCSSGHGFNWNRARYLILYYFIERLFYSHSFPHVYYHAIPVNSNWVVGLTVLSPNPASYLRVGAWDKTWDKYANYFETVDPQFHFCPGDKNGLVLRLGTTWNGCQNDWFPPFGACFVKWIVASGFIVLRFRRSDGIRKSAEWKNRRRRLCLQVWMWSWSETCEVAVSVGCPFFIGSAIFNERTLFWYTLMQWGKR